MATPWDADTYDRVSAPQREWAVDVVGRLARVPMDASVLDVGCGTGLVTETLAAIVPAGRARGLNVSAVRDERCG